MDRNALNQTTKLKPTAPVPLLSGCAKPVTLNIIQLQNDGLQNSLRSIC